MKSKLCKFLVACLLIVLSPFFAASQELTGIWRGYFITESGDQYRLEFQVQQAKSQSVTGVSYSYLDTRFYGKATMTGVFLKKNGTFNIQELKTVEVKNISGGGTCLMNYRFTYARSGKEEFLEGTYLGKSEDKKDPGKNGKWGDCGSGTVVLRRVDSSDFYVEPFLRNKIISKKQIITAAPKKNRKTPVIKKPVAKKQVLVSKKPGLQKMREKQAATTISRRKDTIQKQITAPVVIQKTSIPTPAITRSRKNELAQSFTVSNDDISIRLYDNGEIDGDTISVYLDGKPLVTNKGLSTVPITLHIKMDESNPEHTLVMVAENLGRIPPNTSLMIVQDGDKRYQVSITSTEQKNAMVRFRYQKAH